VYTGLWWGNPTERDHFEEPGAGLDRNVIVKCILKKWDGDAWTGFIWLRMRTRSGRL